jgi:hypothetical protein
MRHKRRNRELADRLVAALNSRIAQFAGSGTLSTVLDPAALNKASRLREGALSADGDVRTVSADVLTVPACLHWSRYQVLPAGQDQDDLRCGPRSASPACSLAGCLIVFPMRSGAS